MRALSWAVHSAHSGTFRYFPAGGHGWNGIEDSWFDVGGLVSRITLLYDVLVVKHHGHLPSSGIFI
jgi:hypothetical protein